MKAFRFLKKPWVIILLVIILATGGYFIYRSAQSQKATTTYKTATVAKGTLTATVSGTGNLIVESSANVNPSISGDVKNVAVKVGDSVKSGQTLFKITNDDLDLAVSKAYASLLQSQQTLTDSQTKLATDQATQTTLNNDPLATDSQKSDIASKIASDQITIQINEINVQSAQSTYNTAKKTAVKRTVTAPISGTVTAVNVVDGDTLGSSGSTSASSTSSTTSASSSTGTSTNSSASVIISDLSTIKASVSLNEVDAVTVQVGQLVSMTFDAIDGLTSTGKVTYIGTSGTETSGVVTYPATISFDSLDLRLKPAMSVSALITTNVKQDILYVPNSAIKSTDNSSYVLTMKDGTPSNQTVTIGIANDSYTEITNGLNEGDTIVTQTITASTSTSSTSSKGNSNSSFGGLTGGGGTPPAGGGPGGM